MPTMTHIYIFGPVQVLLSFPTFAVPIRTHLQTSLLSLSVLALLLQLHQKFLVYLHLGSPQVLCAPCLFQKLLVHEVLHI